MSLLQEYKSSLKDVAIEESVDLFIFRPMAFLFVKVIYPTDITPNQVTLLSMIVGVLSGICYATGEGSMVVMGGILLGFATVFDCADGQLARLKKNGTHLGRVLDGVVDYIYTIAAFLGVAVGCRNESMGLGLWWLFAVSAGASYAIQAGFLDYYRNEYLAHARGRRGFLSQEIEEVAREQEKLSKEQGHYVEKFLLRVYLKYSRFQNQLELKRKTDSDVNSSRYVQENAVMIHLWSINGTSTHVFVLILCSAFGRVDLFLWYILVFGSLYSFLLHIVETFRAKAAR